MTTFHALGNSAARPSRNLEIFPTPAGITLVTMDYDEMTSLCPGTEQPDMARVVVTFAPQALCLESKSLKLYFQTYRNEGIFAEELAAQICEDLFDALQPAWIKVTLTQKRRGGIEIRAIARRQVA